MNQSPRSQGAWDHYDKGESIWDRFLHETDTTPNSDETCDHYHRFDSDLDLLESIGVFESRTQMTRTEEGQFVVVCGASSCRCGTTWCLASVAMVAL